MRRSYKLFGLAVVALAGAAWLATSFMESDGARALESGLDPGEPTDSRAAVDLARAEPRPSGEVDAARTAVAPVEELAAETTDPWAADLGGLIGRVVEEDESPVVGVSVALVQVDANFLLAADWATLGEEPPKLVLETTVTDAEGRFRLAGAYDASYQGLGIDLRGPRSTVRVIDEQLHHGEVTDVGDVVLRTGCTITGRVVDSAGAPVAAARVRIVPSPPGEDLEQFLQVGVQDFRADCAVGISKMIVEGEGSPVIEPPPLVRTHLDDLPIPTTHTDAEGRYRFEGAPIGDLIQGVDKPGLLGVARIVTTTPGEVVLDDAVLTPGRTVQGIVVDEEGDPVAGVEVMAGSELVFGEAAILHPAGPTGADGRFVVHGCPETGGIMACARRSRDEPWVGELGSPGDELEIELESTFALTVHVVDFAGARVRGARVELAPGLDSQSPMSLIGRFMTLGAEPLDARFRETEPGTYVCDEVTPGAYEVTVRPEGLALARKQVEIWEGKADVTLICDRGVALELSVVDAVTGRGVRAARASVLGASSLPLPFQVLAVARTGEDGRAALGPYSRRGPDEQDRGFRIFGDGQRLLVQHPRYADASATLAEGTRTFEVALQPGGELKGRIQWGADPPQRLYMLLLENRERSDDLMAAFLPPRVGRSGLTGTFRFTNLAAGTYRLAVLERYFDKDPIELLMAQKEPTLVHREDGIQVEAGQATDVVIDLSPSGRGQTARLAGTISLDGRPLAGAKVRVRGQGPGASTETDDFGAYETPEFLALGQVNVTVTGEVQSTGGATSQTQLHQQSLTPEPQSVHRLDLDLFSTTVRVTVTASDGSPVADASVSVRAQWRSRVGTTSTDEAGEAELTLVGEGEQVLTASADGFADGTTRVDPSAPGFDGTARIELTSAVPCAGVADLSAFEAASSGEAYLRVTGDGDSSWERLESEDLHDDRRAAFRIEGLQPGSYEARVWIGGEQTESCPFELPPGGDENLVLVFERDEGER